MILYCDDLSYMPLENVNVTLNRMVGRMKTMYDVQQKLKQFGIFIYTGNRLSDLQLMELELNELFEYDLILEDEFIVAKLVIQKEINLMKNEDIHS